jgi:uncharacterized protein (DUF849 family)
VNPEAVKSGWDPLIIAVAPNGARRGKADHPALPVTPDEIAKTAAACREAGAAMIHLHVRDAEGAHTLDVDAYNDAIAAIRQAVGDDLIIQVTSEAVGLYQPAEQMAMVRALRPEAVSLAVREILPEDGSGETAAAEFLAWTRAERIMVQFILYSAEDVQRFRGLRARGVIPGGRHSLLFVLGRYNTDGQSRPVDLLPFLDEDSAANDRWAVCAFGQRENACALAAAALGGDIRVGFENNMLLANGEIAPDNAALVRQAAAGTVLMGRPLAGAAVAREILQGMAA